MAERRSDEEYYREPDRVDPGPVVTRPLFNRERIFDIGIIYTDFLTIEPRLLLNRPRTDTRQEATAGKLGPARDTAALRDAVRQRTACN
ncbi:MAG: hypothetical protein IPK83_07480 [Planctomycetes bacterium]|nr:hypothetical protein [Planctomycetota bacterium]